MSIKRYYENSYEQTFSAHVIACTALEDGHWAVVLDKTCFYPEGGGQPADTGLLNNTHVLDTRDKNGDIIHTTDGALQVGETVTGTINWLQRFSRMQHHSGEHIVSGLIHRLYGYDNVGFHMGRDAVTLDLSGELSTEMLNEVERLANEAVWRNLPISTEYPSPEDLAKIPYRSKKELSGQVRIVTVPDYDICACCGLHVAYTGEIGMIKFVTDQRYKGGTRIWMLCGDDALNDAVQKNRDIFQISGLLSAKPQEVVQAVTRLLEERDQQKVEIADLQTRFFTNLAQQTPAGEFTLQWSQQLTPTELRRYVLALCDRCTVAVVLSPKEALWEYALASSTKDVRPLGKRLNEAFRGRGGGKPGLVQGSLSGEKEAITDFFSHQDFSLL